MAGCTRRERKGVLPLELLLAENKHSSTGEGVFGLNGRIDSEGQDAAWSFSGPVHHLHSHTVEQASGAPHTSCVAQRGGQGLQQGAAEEPPPIQRPPLSCGLEEIKDESKEVLQSSTFLPESRGWPDSSGVDGFRTKPRISRSQHEKHFFIT